MQDLTPMFRVTPMFRDPDVSNVTPMFRGKEYEGRREW